MERGIGGHSQDPPRKGPAQDSEGYRKDAHAVLIGINQYQDASVPDLEYARNDAEALHKVLTDPTLGRFHPDNVILLVDEEATQREIRSAIGTDLPRKAKEGDTVFLFFAGHGAPVIDPKSGSTDGTEKYLVPHDAEAEDLRASGIWMDEIQRFFGWLDASQILLFLDACYSGTAGGRSFKNPAFNTRASLSDEFVQNLGADGKMVITACGANEVSLETPEVSHGLFTHHLMEGLKGAADVNNDGLVTLDELYEYLYENVSTEARKLGGSMKPVRSGSVQGTVYLTQYETDAQRQAREISDRARTAFDGGSTEEAAALWTQALETDPRHAASQAGLDEIAALRTTEQAEDEAQKRVLLEYQLADEMPIEDYDQALAILDGDIDAMTDSERKVRKYIDHLVLGKIRIAQYLQTARLLLADCDGELGGTAPSLPLPAPEAPSARVATPEPPRLATPVETSGVESPGSDPEPSPPAPVASSDPTPPTSAAVDEAPGAGIAPEAEADEPTTAEGTPKPEMSANSRFFLYALAWVVGMWPILLALQQPSLEPGLVIGGTAIAGVFFVAVSMLFGPAGPRSMNRPWKSIVLAAVVGATLGGVIWSGDDDRAPFICIACTAAMGGWMVMGLASGAWRRHEGRASIWVWMSAVAFTVPPLALLTPFTGFIGLVRTERHRWLVPLVIALIVLSVLASMVAADL